MLDNYKTVEFVSSNSISNFVDWDFRRPKNQREFQVSSFMLEDDAVAIANKCYDLSSMMPICCQVAYSYALSVDVSVFQPELAINGVAA